MHTIDAVNEALAHLERLMRASMKAHEGLTELRKELSNEKLESPQRDLGVLTDRQREVFDLIAQDIPVAEIARRLKLSIRTVEAHRNTIRERLKFETSLELSAFAKNPA